MSEKPYRILVVTPRTKPVKRMVIRALNNPNYAANGKLKRQMLVTLLIALGTQHDGYIRFKDRLTKAGGE